MIDDDRPTMIGGGQQPGRLTTGIPTLDQVIGGGVQRGSILLLIGAPGSGKTMLAQQIAFHAAGDGQRVLFLTGYSETQEKLFAHSRSLSFFRPELIGDEILFGNLIDLLRAGSDETQDAIVTTVRRQRATVVVLDGFQGMRRSLPDDDVPGAFLYALGAKLALLGATTVIAMEGDANEPAIYSELTVSDAILSLRREQDGARHRRVLDVVKVRGSNPIIGDHPYIINDNGIMLFPRFESMVDPIEPAWTDERASVGIPEIDTMLGGGLTIGTSSLIAGIPGTGKTLLGLHFAVEGARRGEPTLFVSFLENAVQLRAKARMFGMDLEAAEASGVLRLLVLPPFDVEIDEVAWHISQDIETRGVQRLVIDSISELERATTTIHQRVSTLAALVTYLRSQRVTSYLTRDIPTVIGPEITFAETPLAMVAENLLFMRLAEYRGQLHRLFSVLKMRFSDHERIIHEYAIRPDHGIEMLGAIPPAEGWLTGVARPLWDTGPPTEPQEEM